MHKRCLANGSIFGRLSSIKTRSALPRFRPQTNPRPSLQLPRPEPSRVRCFNSPRPFTKAELAKYPLVEKEMYHVLPVVTSPSDSLTLSHLRAYVVSDIIARYRRMSGHRVVYPAKVEVFGPLTEDVLTCKDINDTGKPHSAISEIRKLLENLQVGLDPVPVCITSPGLGFETNQRYQQASTYSIASDTQRIFARRGEGPLQQLIIGDVVHPGTRLNGDSVRAISWGGILDGDSAAAKALEDSETNQSDVDRGYEIDMQTPPPNLTIEESDADPYNLITNYYGKYGAHTSDLVRAHMVSPTPISAVLHWDELDIFRLEQWLDDINSMHHFFCSYLDQPLLVDMVFGRDYHVDASADDAAILLHAQDTITRVSHIMENDISHLNNAISSLISLTNGLCKYVEAIYDPNLLTDSAKLQVFVQVLSVLLRMLAPFTPRFADSQWGSLELAETNAGEDITKEPWPTEILTCEAEQHLRSLGMRYSTEPLLRKEEVVAHAWAERMSR